MGVCFFVDSTAAEGISSRVIFGGSNLHVYEFTNSIVLVIMNKNQVVCLCSSLPRCVVNGKLVSFLKFVCNKGYLSLRKPFYAILLQVYMNLINFHLLSNLIFKNSPLPLSIVDQKKKNNNNNNNKKVYSIDIYIISLIFL